MKYSDLYYEIATPRQREVLELRESGLSFQQIAEKLGINRRNVDLHMQRLRDKVAKRGESPEHDMTHSCPEGYAVKGVSSYYGADGQLKGQWVKTQEDKEQQLRMMQEAIAALTEEIPVKQLVKHNGTNMPELLNFYPFTDCHLGMMAWHREGGADWDLPTAKETLKRAISDMLERAPAADTGIFCSGGDFMHYDSMDAVTPAHKNLLDADSRPQKMIECAIEVMDYLICHAAVKHKKLYVIIAQGNHDLFSSLWLKAVFQKLYSNNNRIEIVESALPFYALQFGLNLLGWHHGHKVKFDKLPALFFDEYRHLVGSTERTYIHTGHYHHHEIKEMGRTIVEMHRTLAARDAHASYGGYHAERAADVITYHREHGEYSRLTVRPHLYLK